MHSQVERLSQQLQNRQRGLLDQDQMVKTAVLVPFVLDEQGRLSILFEKRAATLRRQAGEICFPGGHTSAHDADEWATAVREACEELGVQPSQLTYVGDLDVLVFVTGLMLYPFAAFLSEPEQMRPNRDEVDTVFTVDLDRLLRAEPDRHELRFHPEMPDDFPFHLIPDGRNYRWRNGTVPELFYEFDNHIIWGMTARILHHVLQFLRA